VWDSFHQTLNIHSRDVCPELGSLRYQWETGLARKASLARAFEVENILLGGVKYMLLRGVKSK